MTTNGAKKRANPTATAESSPAAKRVKPEQPARGRKSAKKDSVKAEESDYEEPGSDVAAKSSPAKRKRGKRAKSSAEPAVAMLPPMARTVNARVLVGAHVSAAGGAQNAVLGSVYMGGNAFALFLKNQRQWSYQPLTDEHKNLFIENCRHHKYDSATHAVPPIVPHGSYLVNLAHTDEARATQAYNHFLDDLTRCHKLGIRLYNFHPGNAVGAKDRSVALKQIATQLNKAHRNAASGKVITLLETMAAVGGNTIGSTFEELAEIIDQVDDKDRVGVCLDTCHVFAAGYDLRTPEAFKETMDKFELTIGFKYLKALHVNDSKAPLGSGRDLHANIGMGFLGLRSFWNLINEPRILGLPCILETPSFTMSDGRSGYSFEIKLLEQLYGKDKESDEFLQLEKRLADQGKDERERVQGQVDRRKTKTPKKGKGKKKDESDSD